MGVGGITVIDRKWRKHFLSITGLSNEQKTKRRIQRTHKPNKKGERKDHLHTRAPQVFSHNSFPTSDTFLVLFDKIRQKQNNTRLHCPQVFPSTSLEERRVLCKKQQPVSHTEIKERPPQSEETCSVHPDAALRFCCYFPGKVEINKSATLPFRPGVFSFLFKGLKGFHKGEGLFTLERRFVLCSIWMSFAMLCPSRTTCVCVKHVPCVPHDGVTCLACLKVPYLLFILDKFSPHI